MAVDPTTGARTDFLDGCSMRPRVSPDGKLLAFEREDALWILGLDPKAKPRRIVGLGGTSSESPPVWSPDGKQIVISLAHAQATRRVNIDGTGSEESPVPPEDLVLDWSSDGRWLLAASHRAAKNGWVLYIMRPDGTEQRRITEEGNPFYARFSPDGRRVLFTDNGRGKQSGIWIVDADGKNARLVFPVGPAKTTASASWSPDGKRIAIILAELLRTAPPLWPVQVVVMDLDGGHRSEIHVPEAGTTDMPDWR
jgi:Tol biopolymer transport system component